MNYYERLHQMLKRHEGVVLKPYKDSVGKLTIGCGRNLTDNGITADEAEYLLNHDIKMAELYISGYDWFSALNEPRRCALTDMMFNLGPNRFREFRNVRRALEQQKFDIAASEMLNSKWRSQVGIRADELAGVIRTGEWP